MQILEKAAETGQTRQIQCFSTRFGGADGAILRERGCFAREKAGAGGGKMWYNQVARGERSDGAADRDR